MGIQYYREMERYGFPARLRRELADLLERHNHEPSNGRRTGKPVSFKTEYRRFVNLCAALSDLRDAGFRKESVAGIRERDVYTLVGYWKGRGESVGTIDNKLSYLRTLAGWMGKGGMIGESKKYFADPGEYKRKTIAEEDKTWSGNGVDVFEVLERVGRENKVIAMQMELQVAFGMRVEESFLYQPVRGLQEALDRAAIHLSRGTKGGRGRDVGLEDVVQLDVLERAAALAVSKDGSMIPREYSLEQWRNRYYYVMRKLGVQREGGMEVTSHGLRHEYLNGVFERITGKPSPVKGGGGYDREVTEMAMRVVVERAGHWSKHKSQAYLGGVMRALSEEKRKGRIAVIVGSESGTE